MAANNEIGVLQPIAEIGAMARERGIMFHTDASQGLGKCPFDVEALPVDLVSFTAHKMYGPKGIGALYVNRKSACVPLSAIMHGGGHERGLRSGTLNVPGHRRLRQGMRRTGAAGTRRGSRRGWRRCATGCWRACGAGARTCGSTARSSTGCRTT